MKRKTEDELQAMNNRELSKYDDELISYYHDNGGEDFLQPGNASATRCVFNMARIEAGLVTIDEAEHDLRVGITNDLQDQVFGKEGTV